MSRESKAAGVLGIFAIICIVLIVLGVLAWGLPQYKIYRLEQNGKAKLAEAAWEKQIKVTDAQADYDAALIIRETKLVEANTTADTNRIVAGSLDPLYVQYLMVKQITDGNTQQIIYLPTEAGIPVTEAGRLQNQNPEVQASAGA